MKHTRHSIPANRPEFTASPIAPAATDGPGAGIRPEFLRLPPPGQQCPWSDLSRSGLNGLILPTAENNFKPPVRSFVLRKKGAKTGIRLIDYASLSSYIRDHEDPSAASGRGQQQITDEEPHSQE